MEARLVNLLKLGILLSFLAIKAVHADTSPPSYGETPASLGCVYGLTPHVSGCPISNTSTVPTGGSGAIAVIDGGYDPNALVELQQFSQQFGLPGGANFPQCTGSNAPCFQVYFASSLTTCTVASNPPPSTAPTGFSIAALIEPEIDIEWSHAMAPNASIYMIVTPGWDIDNMMFGISCANSLLNNSGGIVSMSVSYDEFKGEKNYDSYFAQPGIIYLASSGDYQAPARYPSSSPNVISVGGTNIVRDDSGNYLGQTAWQNVGKTAIPCTEQPCRTGGSGGPSQYEPRPSYQNSVQKIVGNARGTPDVSFVAQSVSVYCCYAGTGKGNQCTSQGSPVVCNADGSGGLWFTSGGTSLATPAIAGIINVAHAGTTSTAQELSLIYYNALKNYQSNWTDIISGNNGYPALHGYDFTTGLGVPRGYGGK